VLSYSSQAIPNVGMPEDRDNTCHVARVVVSQAHSWTSAGGRVPQSLSH